jgi:GT2 family glycosyltransferase
MSHVPVTVGIPTRGRGDRILKTLRYILACDPKPSEIIVYIDGGDVRLVETIKDAFPAVRILSGQTQLGPGGGRHQCILVCDQPFFVSFDDDSYPIDRDFFALTTEAFLSHPGLAVLGATIWHCNETEKSRVDYLVPSAEFTGCGHAIRVAAYREIRGYLPRPIAYAMEETDIAIQLYAKGWKIVRSGALRVFHDTDMVPSHHQAPDITAGTIENIALFAYLHYPLVGWPRGLLQLLNKILFFMKVGRMNGVLKGLIHIPSVCAKFSKHRSPLPWQLVEQFLAFRRTRSP